MCARVWVLHRAPGARVRVIDGRRERGFRRRENRAAHRFTRRGARVRSARRARDDAHDQVRGTSSRARCGARARVVGRRERSQRERGEIRLRVAADLLPGPRTRAGVVHQDRWRPARLLRQERPELGSHRTRARGLDVQRRRRSRGGSAPRNLIPLVSFDEFPKLDVQGVRVLHVRRRFVENSNTRPRREHHSRRCVSGQGRRTRGRDRRRRRRARAPGARRAPRAVN